MAELLSRLWNWLRALFDLDDRPPPRGSRETDGLPPAAPVPPVSPPLPAVPVAPQLVLETDEPPRYVKHKSVLTFQERRFYLALMRAVENNYQILAKVRLADFIYLINFPKDSKFHRNQILCKHVDFLLCESGTLRPLLVIELDDSSHRRPDSLARDEFKNKLFDDVSLPYLRFEIQPSYPARILRERINEKLSSQLDEAGTAASQVQLDGRDEAFTDGWGQVEDD